MATTPLDFKTIRAWDGSQARAFEELSYQLRDPTPSNAELIKTGDPDGGLEWYFRFGNGVEWGWQAKYAFDIEGLLKLMEKSLKTVVAKRPQCRRLTFCIPFDLPDAPGGNERKSARQKFEDRKAAWRRRIKGAERVRIELWSAGELLERLNRDPAQRGKTWFFWDKEVFSVEWCRRRLDITIDAADERYTPELNVELPVAFALEGLAGSHTFWKKYRERRGAVLRAAGGFDVSRYTGVGVTAELRLLGRCLEEWRREVPEGVSPPSRLPRRRLLQLTDALQRAAGLAYPDPSPERRGDPTPRQQSLDDRRKGLRHHLSTVLSALGGFEAFLSTDACVAAEHGALLLTGEAGQGKTHLLCDAGERSLSTGQPAAVVLGGRLTGSRTWSDLAEVLGLEQLGSETLIQGMCAAAEAADRPFLLLVDALNEATEPAGWREELPAVLAEVKQNPWVVLGVSVRSAFLPLVLPPNGLDGRVAEVEHPGFQGREVEATERFFDAFGLEQPRIPLLTPEFTNPLFLKLYCEGLHGLGLTAPPDGQAHFSDVFDRYLQWKSRLIVGRLDLDPSERPVERALDAFGQELAATKRESLARAQAKEITNRFAPHLRAWPKTLFQQLLDEGLLAVDVAWDRDASTYVDVVRFSYQRFADHRVVASLLEPYGSKEQLEAALARGKALRASILAAPAGWIEAFAVQMPERFGVELQDAARWRLDPRRKRIWNRALIRSAVTRRTSAVTPRTRELLTRAQTSRALTDEAFEMLLMAAPIPEHPLNAHWLHRRLLGMSMPERDSAWSLRTYFAFDEQGALDRSIRWAARGSHPDCPDDVLELVAIPLIWTFASPNRRMRDYVTKALARLLSERLTVLEGLIERFRGVNDPYVMERLAVTVHGAVLIGGSQAPNAALALARRLRDVALAPEQVPNILTRDAVRGASEWCLREGLIERPEYESVLPPYRSAPPIKPRTKKQLEKAYDRFKRDRRTGSYIASPYSEIFSSVFDMGDFGRYVIESKVSHFSQHPLEKPYPKRREPRPDRKKLAEVYESLTDEERELADRDDLDTLVATLSNEKLRTWRDALRPSRSPRRKATYPSEFAQRWVFERVISLGWSPERFGSFDDAYGLDSGRSSHKPERFGKKYQWIALRELVARLADNFHMTEPYGDEPVSYEGPWRFYGRDIDPTLPPASRVRDDEDELLLGATFPPSGSDDWWAPQEPRYSREDPLSEGDWTTNTDDVPSFEPLVFKIDSDGVKWIALQAYYNWDEELEDDEERESRRRRDMWSHISSWLVDPADRTTLVSFLESRTLMGKWMPEGRELIDDAYLAEMPWAFSTTEYPDEWREAWSRNPEDEAPSPRVYPAWVEYLWEGNILDCSIDDAVGARLPAPLLFETGALTWRPGTREWYAAGDRLVAQHCTSRDGSHSALLVRDEWLKQVLKELGMALVVGWLGEKRLLESGWGSGYVNGWTEINAIASLAGSKWTFGQRRIEHKMPAQR